MTLRKTILLIIGVLLTGLLGALYAASATILLSSLQKAEAENTRQAVQGFRNVFAQVQNDFSSRAAEWSVSDQTYAFIKAANQNYIESNLGPEALSKSRINLVLFVDGSGRIVYGTGFNLKTKQKTLLSKGLQQYLSANHLLLRHPNLSSKLAGIILLPKGPTLIASQPILNSEGKGPTRGTLLLGRYLDASEITRLTRITQLSLTIHSFNRNQMPPDFQVARSLLSTHEHRSTIVRPLNPDYVAGYTLLRDLYGKPGLLVRVDSPRTIYQQGQNIFRYLALSLILVVVVFGVATILLEKMVLSRLSRLSAGVSSIRISGDLSARVPLIAGKDELSSLTVTINGMLAALEHSQHEQRQSEQRLRRQSAVLAELAKRKVLDHPDLRTSLREITEAAARTLEVERASVWLYNQDHNSSGDDPRTKIRCIDLYEQSIGRHSEGAELTEAGHPAYFQALEADRIIAAHDAHTDPRTKEFSQLYFSPLGITSLLDAPIRLGGRMIGTVSHEHVGRPRRWALEEQNFTGSIADLVSLTMEAWERQQSEEALQQSEKHFRSLIENASDIITILNSDKTIRYESPSIEQVLGYRPEDLTGKNILEFVHPEDSAIVIDAFTEVRQNLDATPSIEFRFQHKDNSWRILEAIAGNLPASSDVAGVTLNSRDITERKRTEEELKTFARKLEQSNRELQDFASVASHDLQEPLRKVQAFGDRLKAKCGNTLGEEGGDYLERMQNAARRMQTLINDLLTFSRVTTRAQPFVPVNLTQVVQEVLSDLEVRIEQEGGQIEVSDLPIIDADPTQMRQLLQNLIGNALKFHQAGTAPVIKLRSQFPRQESEISRSCLRQTVYVGWAKDSTLLSSPPIPDTHFLVSPQSTKCQIIVEDNGIGFDEKYLDRIFTVFQRLHGRTEYEGSGIGLAVCRKIVQRHGGSITAKSTPGQGTTFVVTLPIKQPQGITEHEPT